MPATAHRGRVYRRCACRGADGKQLGARCPTLKTAARHGSWTFAVDMPALAGKRSTMRRGGYPTRAAAVSGLDHVLACERSGIVFDDTETVADYLTAMKPTRHTLIHGTNVDLELLERPINGRYLSLTEREQIHDLHQDGSGVRAIAHELGRAPSTISRELARNSSPELGYLPYAAHRAAVARRPRPKAHKLLADGPLRDYVVAGLARKWSLNRSVVDW